jgi:hypothetical protein
MCLKTSESTVISTRPNQERLSLSPIKEVFTGQLVAAASISFLLLFGVIDKGHRFRQD